MNTFQLKQATEQYRVCVAGVLRTPRWHIAKIPRKKISHTKQFTRRTIRRRRRGRKITHFTTHPSIYHFCCVWLSIFPPVGNALDGEMELSLCPVTVSLRICISNLRNVYQSWGWEENLPWNHPQEPPQSHPIKRDFSRVCCACTDLSIRVQTTRRSEKFPSADYYQSSIKPKRVSRTQFTYVEYKNEFLYVCHLQIRYI